MTYNRFIGRDGLKDRTIIKALNRAATDYANGEVSEVRDTLADIVRAIDEFDRRCQESGGCI